MSFIILSFLLMGFLACAPWPETPLQAFLVAECSDAGSEDVEEEEELVLPCVEEGNELGKHIKVTRAALVFCSTVNACGFFIGLVCNILVIVTISMTRKLYKSSINRAVMNLCFANVLVVVLDIPLTNIILFGNFTDQMVINS